VLIVVGERRRSAVGLDDEELDLVAVAVLGVAIPDLEAERKAAEKRKKDYEKELAALNKRFGRSL
jgi:hypothetical protein